MAQQLHLYCDGGARKGVSGIGVAGFVRGINGQSDCIHQEGLVVSNRSNNVAEYEAMLLALVYAAQSDHTDIWIYSDAEVVVKHINGRVRARHESLVVLANTAKCLVSLIRASGKSVEVIWIPRERNKCADRLASIAMDQKLPRKRKCHKKKKKRGR